MFYFEHLISPRTIPLNNLSNLSCSVASTDFTVLFLMLVQSSSLVAYILENLVQSILRGVIGNKQKATKTCT